MKLTKFNSTTSEYRLTTRPFIMEYSSSLNVRSIFQYIFTFFFLCLSIIVYTVIGAIIFRKLELPVEKENRLKLINTTEQYRVQLLRNIQNVTISHFDKNEGLWFQKIALLFRNMEIHLGVDVDRLKYEEKWKWSFIGSLFFSATVITSIGYGHIAPVTRGGRIFCMAYAVFGISLLLLVLASIGSLLARGATLTYRQLHSKMKRIKLGGKKDSNENSRYGGRGNNSYDNGVHQNGAAGSSVDNDVIQEIWGTIRFDKDGKIIIPENANPNNESEDDNEKGLPNQVRFDNETFKTKSETIKGMRNEHDHVVVSGGQFATGDNNVEYDEEEEAHIPVYIVIALAFVYIILLASLLVIWETEWSFFDAIYFSFVTLTTIGFGDLVPQHQKYLLSCTFLIIFGMAVMSMCIALAQEMIMRKIAWISQKIGVALIKTSQNND